MLALRPICEHCGKNLPPDTTEAMICSFECTFCAECVQHILGNVCPNCGGGFEKRPNRPKEALEKYPPQSQPFLKPIDISTFTALRLKNQDIKPHER